MKVHRIRRLASGAVVAGLATLVVACGELTNPSAPIFWQANFSADPTASLIITGRAEMVANPTDTSAGVFLGAAVDERTLVYWHIRNGPCNGPGERVAPADAFPPVAINIDGDGMAVSFIRRRLPAGAYAAEVFEEPEGAGARLACADLN